MNRSFFARLGIGLAALALAPAAYLGLGEFQRADAQGVPPQPPSTYYGTISGAEDGSGIVAGIGTGGSSRSCGTGRVLTDSGQLVYVVDVVTDDQISGCGASGRTIRFYIAPKKPGGGGKFASQTANWQSAGAHQQNLSAGNPLQFVLYTPQVAAKVPN